VSGPVRAPTTPRSLGPAERVRLAGEILRTYGRARWRLWRGDLPSTLRALRGDPPPAQAEVPERGAVVEGVLLGDAVARTLRLVPAESRCLMRSLVLTSLLARRGVGSSLVIGVRGGDAFGAHAWVEVAERPLLPPGGETYERLVEL
jgi:hypothetical protein